MEKREEKVVICPECGLHITKDDRDRENVREIGEREYHKKCKLIRK